MIELGKLTAENMIKMQFGSSMITRVKETGEIISLPDDLKAAATDALKNSITWMLGFVFHPLFDIRVIKNIILMLL